MMISGEAARFWVALINANSHRVRFTRSDLLEAFGRALPHSQGDVNLRERLGEILNELAESGLVRLPRTSNRRGYDHSERTTLPRFVKRLDNAKETRKQVFWRPELAFAQHLPSTWHNDLLAVQNWLRNGGLDAPIVALRERSVEIFGDEKRLDAMLGTKVFAGGHLSLELLKCYLPTIPIYIEGISPDQTDRPLLVVENHTTFDTFRKWNKQHRRYSAVAFGAGTAFVSSCQSLRAHLTANGCSGEVLYFGDVDPKGLWIPLRAIQETGIEIRPERMLYDLLFRKARTMDILAHDPFSFDPDLVQWLQADLRGEAIRYLSIGRRLPQEILSFWDIENPELFRNDPKTENQVSL